MPELDSEQRTSLSAELIYGRKTPLRIAIGAAAGFGLIAALEGVALVNLIPLKETQAYLAIVDKDTGIAERTVEVQKAIVDHADAIVQSLIFNYVQDRETYDEADNEKRIREAFIMSGPDERAKLDALWSDGENPEHPGNVYGQKAIVQVDITSITPLSDSAAQVRFTKTLSQPGQPVKTGKFYATVSYEFTPEGGTNLNLIWRNPYGFSVTGYRTAAETMEK